MSGKYALPNCAAGTAETKTTTIAADDPWYKGITPVSGARVPWGATLYVTAEVCADADCILTCDVNCYPDGAGIWNGNDNDSSRNVTEINGKALKSNVWTYVRFSYTNADSRNTGHVDLVDSSILGLKESSHTGKAVNLSVRHAMASLSGYAAWAPAAGETLSGGGSSMSANLLAGYAPGLVSGTTKYTGAQVTPECDLFSSTAYTADNHTDTTVHYARNGNFPTLSKLTANQTVTMSFGIKAASSTSFSAGKLHVWVKYKDAAGNVNWVSASAQSETISQSGWTRIAGTVVVPSGMTIAGCGVSKYQGAGAFIQTDVTLSYGSGVPVAEETFTPFETASHVAAEYSTKASQKILSDSITSEVNARAKTDGAVSELSSKMEQTVNGINVSLDKLTATERQIHSWFDFGADASGNPKLSMGSSSSPIIGEYSNTGTTYKDRSGATLLALDAANSTTGADHMVAKDMTIGKWQWVPTNGGDNLTLVWIGG